MYDIKSVYNICGHLYIFVSPLIDKPSISFHTEFLRLLVYASFLVREIAVCITLRPKLIITSTLYSLFVSLS